jgi:hypothetical protein
MAYSLQEAGNWLELGKDDGDARLTRTAFSTSLHFLVVAHCTSCTAIIDRLRRCILRRKKM